MTAIVHLGAHTHRLSPEAGNPREVAFSTAWAKCNESYHTLDHLLREPPSASGELFGAPLFPLTQEHAITAASVIQWLGSPVGFSFLDETLSKAGYTLARTRMAA